MADDKSIELICFEEIKTAIEDNIPEIKRVVAWNNQPQNEREERPYNYPYVGVDIQVNWLGTEAKNNVTLNHLQNQQKGNAVITVHIVCESLKHETDAFTDWKPIAHEVHRALNYLNYDGDDGNFEPLDRTASGMDNNHDRVIDFIYVYRSMLTECGIEANLNTVTIEDQENTRGQYD